MKLKKLLFPILLFWFFLDLTAQPLLPVRMCAEWEPAIGTLIRYPFGIPFSLIVELAEDDSLYVLVEDQDEQTAAYYSILAAGADIDHCCFITTNTYSHWTRDWGPVSVFDGIGDWGIVDPMFDGYPWVPGDGRRGWEEDDTVNPAVAEFFDCPVYQLPAYFTGGNIMTDGLGTAFSTEQMISENLDLMDEETFLDLIENYCGIDNYHIVNNTEDYGIQHIDCAAKLIDEETVLIKQLPVWHPENDRIEDLVEYFESIINCFGRPYKIHRIYCGSYNGTEVAAYTNSLILNQKVLVPLFDIDSDSQAILTYQEIMPGYEIIGISYDNWYYYDALHCRTRGIFDRNMLYLSHRPLDDPQDSEEDYFIGCYIKDLSGSGLIEDELKLFWRIYGNEIWNIINLIPANEPDYFYAYLPTQSVGSEIEYYLSAADYSGRTSSLPRTAPINFYSFSISANSYEYQLIPDLPVSSHYNYPNPFNPHTTVCFELNKNTWINLSIFNLKGEKIIQLSDNILNCGKHYITWNGKKGNGNNVPNGIYFYQLKGKKFSYEGKMVLLK